MKKQQKKSPQARQRSRGMTEPNSQSPVANIITRQDTKRKDKIMDFFFILLSLALTFGICWLIDRENMANHAIAIIILEVCTLFWVVFPKV